MSLTKKLSALTLSILLGASVSLMANASDSLFAELDADDSGTISQSEASAHATLSAMFDDVDTNADGEISYSEFVAADLED